MKQALAAMTLAAGISSASVNAEMNDNQETVATQTSIQAAAILDCKKLKTQVDTNLNTQSGIQELLNECKQQTGVVLEEHDSISQPITAKQTREFLISRGLDPKKLPGVTVTQNQYMPGQFQKSIQTSELGLTDQTPFTVDNIGYKFEETLISINAFQVENKSQEVGYIAGDWIQEFIELSPNEDEVEVLNALIAQLPESVKPLPIANALTGVIALNKYKTQNFSELSETEKVILISNVYSVVSVLDPKKAEGNLSLVLPAGLDIKGQKLESPKTYPSINVDKQVVQMIADLGVDLPIEMVNGFQDIHQEYQSILAELKQKADSQDSEKRAERYMRFHDQYANAFEQMSTTSKIDMLQILATGNDEGSKLKGQKLLDKASEYISIMDGGFTEKNVKKLRIYHNFIAKYNQTGDDVLNDIVLDRIDKIVDRNEEMAQRNNEMAQRNNEMAQRNEQEYKELIKLQESNRIKTNNLEELIALRKQMEMLAYNSN